MLRRVVYIDRNFIEKKYPNSPNDGDSFYTHGFGSFYARQFKNVFPEINVECWKCDPRISKVTKKEINGVIHIVFPSINFYKIGQYSKSLINHVKIQVSKEDYDTVYNISSYDHLLFYSLAKKLKTAPLVVQHHGESPPKYRIKKRRDYVKLFWLIMSPIINNCFKHINLLYVLDEKVIDWLPNTISYSKIKLSTTGVDEKIFTPIDKNTAKMLLNLDPSKKHILFVGKLDIIKRPDLLIDVFVDLKSNHSNIELILAGNNNNETFYKKAKESGAILKGQILQTELYIWLSAADVYVLPKLDSSIPFGGIGMLSVQALFCNTPIVGSTVMSFPANERSKIGIVASNHEEVKRAIISILEGKSETGKNLRDIAIKYYSWENICKKTKNDYESILEESQRNKCQY